MPRLPVPAQSAVTAVRGGVKTEATRVIEITRREVRKQNLQTLYFLLLKALRNSWFTTPKSFATLHVLVTIKEK